METEQLSPQTVSGRDGSGSSTTVHDFSLGIVVELDNIRTSAISRAESLFRALAFQTRKLSNRLSGPVEIKVVHDPVHVSLADVDTFLSHIELDDLAFASLEIIGAPGVRYYEQKNIGAEACNTEIVILVDSDLEIADDWLLALMTSFSDPGVHFVCGETRFETTNIYDKSFALLFETFPIGERSTRELIEQPYFLANSVAYRKKTFPDPIFPLSDTFRGQCRTASMDVQRAGHQIFMQTQAKARHPAPNGIQHFFARALVSGHDEMIDNKSKQDGTLINKLKASPVGAASRLLKSSFRAWGRCFTHHRAVDLPFWQVPAAMGIAVIYYSLRFVSELLTFCDPRLIRSIASH